MKYLNCNFKNIKLLKKYFLKIKMKTSNILLIIASIIVVGVVVVVLVKKENYDNSNCVMKPSQGCVGVNGVDSSKCVYDPMSASCVYKKNLKEDDHSNCVFDIMAGGWICY